MEKTIAEVSGVVYHWATITAGRYGRSCGWFAGWWNCLAWLFGLASTAQIIAAQTVSMYAVRNPGFVTQRWHVFVSYLLVTWITGFVVLYLNRALPKLETMGGFTIVSGVLITIIVCAVMPKSNGTPYATAYSVWADWENTTGYSSSGFVFLLGMLNGSFSVGTPDIVTHLAEEVPQYVSNRSSDSFTFSNPLILAQARTSPKPSSSNSSSASSQASSTSSQSSTASTT